MERLSALIKSQPTSIRILLAMLLAVTCFVLLNLGFFVKNALYFTEQALTNTESPLPAETLVFKEPDTLYIDALHVEAPVIYITQKGEAVYQEALAHGVVHYPGSALPGKPGNVYIFGHSSDFIWAKGNYKTIFATLPNIKIGEIIQLTDSTGQVFSYRVRETKVVEPGDLSVLSQGDGTESLLSVQTSYPIGTALARFVAVAELVPLTESLNNSQ